MDSKGVTSTSSLLGKYCSIMASRLVPLLVLLCLQSHQHGRGSSSHDQPRHVIQSASALHVRLLSGCLQLHIPHPSLAGTLTLRVMSLAAHVKLQTQEMIETFIQYHDSIKKCICVVYDPQKSQRGQVAMKAVRLKDSFIELFKEQKLTGACSSNSGSSP